MSQMKVVEKENRLLEAFHRYGWLLLFGIVCFSFYSHGMRKKSKLCSELREKIVHLESLKSLVKSEQEHLALQIHSQSDPEWIELVLKQRLGVVPEGQMKVYFKRDD